MGAYRGGTSQGARTGGGAGGGADGRREDSRGRGFPRTGILPNVFDGRERAVEARGCRVMGGRSEVPTNTTFGKP